MFDLSPVKILIVLVVALLVLGPDKLPAMARQIGAAWADLRRWRERLEHEVRGSFPDLPSSAAISEAVRSPLSFLDRLADQHGQPPVADDTSVGAGPPGAPAPGADAESVADLPSAGPGPEVAERPRHEPAAAPVPATEGLGGLPEPPDDPSMN